MLKRIFKKFIDAIVDEFGNRVTTIIDKQLEQLRKDVLDEIIQLRTEVNKQMDIVGDMVNDTANVVKTTTIKKVDNLENEIEKQIKTMGKKLKKIKLFK